MPPKRKGRLAGFVTLAVLALWCVFFAPVQLGGSTLFSSTVGDSMEPRFHKGDLAVIRVASSYRVGEIVLYHSTVLNRPVLHRIIVIQDGHYYFKGDHNDFVDPGYVTRGALLGKLWFRVPRAGLVLGWFGAPAHAAILAGLAAVFLILGGGRKTTRRRRHGRRRTAGSKRPAMRRPWPTVVHRPRKSVENIVGGGTLLLAVVLLAVGFGSPLARQIEVPGFKHSGTFSYTAKVVHPPVAAYPSGLARTGDPLFLSVFKLVNAHFAYRFTSNLPHHVHGTVELVALISSDSKIQNRYVLDKAETFRGDTARVGGMFDLQGLRALMTQLSVESGDASASYAIDLQPIVHVTGTVGENKVKSTFSPTLPFTATQAALTPNIAQAATLPGASYTPPSGAAALSSALKPVETGKIPGIAPNYLSLARYHFAVSTVRGAGLGLLGLAVLVLLGKLFKGSREVWSNEKRIATRYESVIIDVVSVGDDRPRERAPTEVPDFESLARLAKYCERPILRAGEEGAYLYAVEDEGNLYLHRPAARTPGVAAAVAGTPATTVEPIPAARPVSAAALGVRGPTSRTRRKLITRALGALFALAVTATLVTGFTATNTVSLTHAASTDETLAISQAVPAQCAGLTLTNLVIASSTSTTVTGTNANDLILGRSGTGSRSLSGGGGTDCIVGGGGSGTTNNFNANKGADICLGAPNATNNYSNCETKSVRTS
jgi:signal peptidase I